MQSHASYSIRRLTWCFFFKRVRSHGRTLYLFVGGGMKYYCPRKVTRRAISPLLCPIIKERMLERPLPRAFSYLVFCVPVNATPYRDTTILSLSLMGKAIQWTTQILVRTARVVSTPICTSFGVFLHQISIAKCFILCHTARLRCWGGFSLSFIQKIELFVSPINT